MEITVTEMSPNSPFETHTPETHMPIHANSRGWIHTATFAVHYESRLVALNRYFDALCGMEVMTAVRVVNIDGNALLFSVPIVHSKAFLGWTCRHLMFNRVDLVFLRHKLGKIRPECTSTVTGRSKARVCSRSASVHMSFHPFFDDHERSYQISF